MKKLGICLLALAMVLGFASCNKDAETTKKKGWYESEVWYKYYSNFNDAPDDAEIYWSEEAAIEALGEDALIQNPPVLVYDNPKFTKITSSETYIKANGIFPDKPDMKDGQLSLIQPVKNILYNLGIGIVNDQVIILIDHGWGLKQTEDTTKKLVTYFDDGTKLVYYGK